MTESGSSITELPIAVIGRRRGSKGEVVLHTHFDLQQATLEGADVMARWHDGRELRLRIERIWWHGERTICQFAQCSTIADAQELRHAELWAQCDSLSPTKEEEYYAVDIIGCTAVLRDGKELGSVTGVSDNAGAVVLTVAGEREYLIPLARQIVVEIDIERKKLIVDPPPGLLELNEN